MVFYCHKNKFNNAGEIKPKITGEIISKLILNIVFTFNLPFDMLELQLTAVLLSYLKNMKL